MAVQNPVISRRAQAETPPTARTLPTNVVAQLLSHPAAQKSLALLTDLAAITLAHILAVHLLVWLLQITISAQMPSGTTAITSILCAGAGNHRRLQKPRAAPTGTGARAKLQGCRHKLSRIGALQFRRVQVCAVFALLAGGLVRPLDDFAGGGPVRCTQRLRDVVETKSVPEARVAGRFC